jgi:hypothetical protein
MSPMLAALLETLASIASFLATAAGAWSILVGIGTYSIVKKILVIRGFNGARHDPPDQPEQQGTQQDHPPGAGLAGLTGTTSAEVPGFGSWALSEEEELHREWHLAERWELLVQRALEDHAFEEHAEAINYVRRVFSASGRKLKVHAWAIDNRIKTRVKVVKVGRITKWHRA